MTSSEIRNNIRYNENLINQYNAEKCNINNKLDELECLRNKFSTLQNDFGNRQYRRQQSLSVYSSKKLQNKIFGSYCIGMSSLLKGVEFNNTYEGLSFAKQKINKKMQELLNNLSNCESKIANAVSQKEYWKAQLVIAEAKEDDDGYKFNY